MRKRPVQYRGVVWLVLGTVSLLMPQGVTGAPESSVQQAPKAPTKSSRPVSRSGLVQSQEIDRLITNQLEANKIAPNPPANDATFVRRLYLDLIGRIPTADEVRRFLASSDPDKRSQLIDRLLDSPGYASHQFHFWADLLRAKHRLDGGNPGGPYVEFIKDAVQKNLPYDEFVRQLLKAEGPILEPGHGAAGYYLRDFNMPEDNMANTVRVFLGTRLECAQCHDHPFDKWTQREFYEMVAFNGGMRMRVMPSEGMRPLEVRRELQRADVDADVKQAALRILRPLSFGVQGGGTGLVRLPDTYQYDDGKPNEVITAKTLFEHKPLVKPEIPRRAQSAPPPQTKKKKGLKLPDVPGARDIQSRDALADWLTAPENPRFTRVIANRMWKQLFGLGLIEPVDDITDETTASNPALLEYLTSQMQELKYDLKQFQRMICHTEAYQRESSAVDLEDPHAYHFPGPLMRRMTAEQLWDSFLTLAVPDLDTKQGPPKGYGRGSMMAADIEYDELSQMSVTEIVELAEEQVALRKDPQRRQQFRREMLKTAMENGVQSDSLREARTQIEQLREAARQARQKKDPQAARKAQEKIRELAQTLRGDSTRRAPDLVRASELPSPAPAGHFLREFGQSDREQIQNANSQPAVTQVLSLMNGTIETRVIQNPNTVLMRQVMAADKPQDRVDVVYLSLLSRFPTREEKSLWLKEGQRYGADAAFDLIWVLANSNEFMFVR